MQVRNMDVYSTGYQNVFIFLKIGILKKNKDNKLFEKI